MLQHLYIKNFTLIDTLDIDFRPAFSAITGETGAGKSIIIGAINLLLGQRADSRLLKEGSDRCVIEAVFDTSRYDLSQLFADNDIDYDGKECIMRRELTAAGKSRAFINDSPVPLSVMRTIGTRLVDIHSQHQNLLLSYEDFQLNVVDIIAADNGLIDDYKHCFAEYNGLRHAADKLRADISRSRENEDYLRFQADELDNAALSAGMQEELERENAMLSHAEEIKTALCNADETLNGNGGAVERLKEASRLIAGIKELYPNVADAARRIDSCYIEIKDIARDISAYASGMDYDPQRLEKIGSQLDVIYSLQHKHHVDSVEALIKLRDNIKAQLAHIDNSDEELRLMDEKTKEAKSRCEAAGAKLSAVRRTAAARIEKEMRDRLVPLGIPNVRFSIEIKGKPLSADGADSVAFLFSANTGTAMQPVADVASGGEIARVMLSIKAMISGAVRMPTIIFDEIDTGVSGKTAEQMANIMREMGCVGGRQVISITHLPQIAASAETHYKVYKEETPQGTATRMTMLDTEGRVNEIAQMLSGAAVTNAAVSNARELLRRK